MKILVEGQRCKIAELKDLLDDSQFYKSDGELGVINHVGFCHSLDTKEVIYFLPKVFIIHGKLFGQYKIEEFSTFTPDESFSLSNNSWLGKLLLLFFKGIVEFKRRNPNSKIIERGNYYQLSSNLGDTEYSRLDISLQILDYFKKEKEKILFRNARRKSSFATKMNWRKTIDRQMPILSSEGSPIYTEIHTKKKQVDNEEALLTIFYSILTEVSNELGFNLGLSINYRLYTGSRFKWLESNGIRLLKKIKYKYFSDDLKKIYNLSYLFLNKNYSGNLNRKRQEFIAIRDYNIVFEDMVDKLFTDKSLLKFSNNGVSIEDLKNNRDGKIIDHIFKYDSLIGNTDILYIGDSKYYKPDHKADALNIYKQFTYAKNVVQFNIDLLNNPASQEITGVKYFDEVTDGYNITPNFLLYAFIPFDGRSEKMVLNYIDHKISDHKADGKPKISYHFKDRLFDRDTLFVHQYQINFLFVLYSYCVISDTSIRTFRAETKKYFRNRLVSYFDSTDSEFTFHTKTFDSKAELQGYVYDNFRTLTGKVICLNDTTLLLALPLDRLNQNEELKILSEDFQTEFEWKQ